MITHNQIKFIQSLKQKKNRSEYFVVEGEKMVEEAINSAFEIECIYLTSSSTINHKKCEIVSEKDMSRMTHFKNSSNALALLKQKQNTVEINANSLQIVLDNIKDPGNLGTIIRTADWFGIKDIFCSKETVDLYNSKTIQSSMGSIFRVNVNYVDLNSFLIDQPNVMGAILNGENIYESKLPENGLLIIGSESHGISENVLKHVTQPISIPNFGKAESLNAAIACSIILSEIKRN